MTDEVLDEIAYLSFELDQELIDLKRTYYDKLKNEISLKNAARFIQIENQLQSIIDFQVSSQIPLLK